MAKTQYMFMYLSLVEQEQEKVIDYMQTNKLLVILSDNTDELSVLKTVPNGAGAFNINGLTIHRALAIFKTLSADHAILSKDNVNV